jgi:hypothetical protein
LNVIKRYFGQELNVFEFFKFVVVEKEGLDVMEMFEGKTRWELCYFVVGEVQLDDVSEVLEKVIFLENEFLLSQDEDSHFLGMLNVPQVQLFARQRLA